MVLLYWLKICFILVYVCLLFLMDDHLYHDNRARVLLLCKLLVFISLSKSFCAFDSWSCSSHCWTGSLPCLCCKEEFFRLNDKSLVINHCSLALHLLNLHTLVVLRFVFCKSLPCWISWTVPFVENSTKLLYP